MKRILFVTYGGGHVAMVVPIVKALQMRVDVDVVVMGLTSSRPVLERESIRCFSFRDLPISDVALKRGAELAADLDGHPSVPLEETIAYLGLSYQDMVADYGEKEAANKYSQLGRQAFLPVKLMEKVITEGRYNLVVATNSPRAEQAAIIAAGKLKVRSVCMVDLFALQEIKWISQPGYATKVCVLSDYVKSNLIAAGRSGRDVVVTGNPAFDSLADPDYKVRGEKLRTSKGWESKKVVLWCSQLEPLAHPFTGRSGNPKLPYIIDTELNKICRNHSDEGWHLVVRLHPSETLKIRDTIDGVEYDVSSDLVSQLHAADVVVVTSSTVGLQAALIGKPVLALGMSIFSPDAPYEALGVAKGVDSFHEIDRALESVISGDWVPKAKLPEVGSATTNVVNVINTLI